MANIAKSLKKDLDNAWHKFWDEVPGQDNDNASYDDISFSVSVSPSPSVTSSEEYSPSESVSPSEEKYVVKPRKSKSRSYWECDHCGQKNYFDDLQCQFCGAQTPDDIDDANPFPFLPR